MQAPISSLSGSKSTRLLLQAGTDPIHALASEHVVTHDSLLWHRSNQEIASWKGDKNKKEKKKEREISSPKKITILIEK